MKKYLILVGLSFLVSGLLKAQQNPAEELANRIANKMKDTLNLSNDQRTQIFNINMQLHNQKTLMRQQYANTDSLRIHLQVIENTRDSLYHTVLSTNDFQLYKQKKRNLVSAN